MENNRLTKEKLKMTDPEKLVEMILLQQQQIEELQKLTDLMSEEIRNLRSDKFGRSTEKDLTGEQLYFAEAFNEAEGFVDESLDEPTFEQVTYKRKKRRGKREADLSAFPVTVIEHEITDEELEEYFPEGYERFPDEIYRKLEYHPATFEVLEHHIAVYRGKNGKIKRAEHPAELLKNSIATPSLTAGIMNAKYVNAMPLYRIEKEFERIGLTIGRQVMANWMIKSGERYLSLLADRMKEELFTHHVIHADETVVKVSKDGRKAGSESRMWVYRSNEKDEHPVILYDYRKTRKTDHLKDFLGNFAGCIVSDGYVAYHKLADERPDQITACGCWAHCRRKFAQIIKSSNGSEKKKEKYKLAAYAVKQISNIYHLDNQLSDMQPKERKKERELTIKPIVEAFFAWAKKHYSEVPPKSNIGKALDYAINQESYLKQFLYDPEVPLDNNSAERAIRPFVIGKNNWHMIDTIPGAEASAIIYSIAETAKANHLKPYEYFRYVLTEIPKHMDDKDLSFLEELLPWSASLPDQCQNKKEK